MSRKLNRVLLALAALAVALFLGVAGFETYVFSQITAVDPGANENLANRPDAFRLNGYDQFPDFDTSPYEMPTYETVSLPSRAAGVDLAGWFVPGDPAAAAVVLTHGFRGCTCEPSVLVPAGMLHQSGFNVLLIDLRNHGQSTVTNGHAAFGSTEYLDVLGAWDWLATQRGFAPSRIGLFGGSMGAATSLIALAQEPGVPAAWADSPFFAFEELLRDNLAPRGLPGWLAPGAIRMGRLAWGDDLYAHRPSEAFLQDRARPLYVVHGTADQRIALYHDEEYRALAQATGANATFWLVAGAGHQQSSFLVPDEYERRLVAFFHGALGD
jgi:dipeptidyl aminopeptidase/acylaminoacyl peptidase